MITEALLINTEDVNEKEENNSNIIERQSINGQTRTPISLDVDSDEISFFGSEKMGGICAMDVRKDGKIEVVVFDWQGNRKRTLHRSDETVGT